MTSRQLSMPISWVHFTRTLAAKFSSTPSFWHVEKPAAKQRREWRGIRPQNGMQPAARTWCESCNFAHGSRNRLLGCFTSWTASTRPREHLWLRPLTLHFNKTPLYALCNTRNGFSVWKHPTRLCLKQGIKCTRATLRAIKVELCASI